MSQSGEVADLFIKESIQVSEHAAKLAALGAEKLAALLVALANDSHKMQGMTNLKNLLKADKPLCILQIKEDDLKKFSAEAKKYGVLFSAVTDKQNKSGLCDIIAKQDDIAKINHIVDKLGLNTPAVDEAEKKDKTEDAPDKAKDKGEKSTDAKEKPPDGKNLKTRESENPSEKRYTARAGNDKDKTGEVKASVKEKVREIKAMKNPTPDKVPDLVRASRKSAQKVNAPQRAVAKAIGKAKDEVTKTAKQTKQTTKSNKEKER